jgi:hypothetical protein
LPVENVSDIGIGGGSWTTVLGHRRCPNPSCRSHLFVAYNRPDNAILVSYPAERIDFDTADIPAEIVSALTEAITCHANQCFVAAAIMVRKTLEELCRLNSASGSNLKERIRDLGTKIVIPKDLFDGLDDLRLLGNDAAHFESRVFDDIGQDELEAAIDFTKEVLKATYQYKALVNRLRALKKP